MTNILNSIDKASILVVDDNPDNISLIQGILKEHYKVKVANGGERALQIAQSDKPPALILLDIMMPVMDGYEVCRRLKADFRSRNIPVIFLTAKSSAEDEALGLELGAVDFLSKPINPPIALARIKNHIALKQQSDLLQNTNNFIENELINRSRELAAVQDVTILAMASLAETRDSDTGNHIRRTQFYVKALAEKLSTHPKYSGILTTHFIFVLYKSAPLHDIGKIGIPDRILMKPGKLTVDEFDIMKTHTTLGRDSIERAETAMNTHVEFLTIAKEIAYGHQEKWDGSGYPEGVAGENIPVSARLMAVADVYDALISRRVYKIGFSHEQAVELMQNGRGKHFDPDMIDAFIEIQETFRGIAQQYVDSDMDMEKKKVQFDRLYEGAQT